MKKASTKLAALLVVMTLLVSVFAACGGGSSSSAAPAASEAASTAASSEAAESAAAPEDASEAAPAANFDGVELVVATWGGSSAEGLAKIATAFEEQYGCTIIMDETAGNSDRLNKIRAQKDAPQIDVALMTDCFAIMGNEEGLFEKIDTSVVTNMDKLYDFAVTEGGYGPAYSITRYGFVYNADEVEAPATYEDMFNGDYKVSIPDMTGTAGPMLLVTLAESKGGSMEDIDPGFEFLAENRDTVTQFYASGSDAITGLTTGETNISLFMDMFVPILQASGVNAEWADAEEGSFAGGATVNVIKDCPNPELAQLFVNFMLEASTQEQVAEILSEGPTNREAVLTDEVAKYLAYGEEEVAKLRTFDWAYINGVKPDWIERYQKEVTSA